MLGNATRDSQKACEAREGRFRCHAENNVGSTGFFTHEDCRKHVMGAGHPESPERLDAIEDRLLVTGVGDALERRQATPAAIGELRLAHGRRHGAALRGLTDMLAEEMAKKKS